MPASSQVMTPRKLKEDWPVHMRPVDASGHQVVGILDDSANENCVANAERQRTTNDVLRRHLEAGMLSGYSALPAQPSGTKR